MANEQFFEFEQKLDIQKFDKLNSEPEILIGFQSGLVHNQTGEELAEIAKKLTFGAGPQVWRKTKIVKGKKKTTRHSVSGIPARPFLEEGIMNGIQNIDKRVQKYYEIKLAGGNADQELDKIGLACVSEIQQFMTSDYYKTVAPNSPETIRAKKSDKPLIDEGQLMQAVRHVVQS